MAHVPLYYGALMTYRTRAKCVDLPQDTTQRTALSPRLWKPGISIAGMMASRTIVAPMINTRQTVSPELASTRGFTLVLRLLPKEDTIVLAYKRERLASRQGDG
jgi:hypothetical protein